MAASPFDEQKQALVQALIYAIQFDPRPVNEVPRAIRVTVDRGSLGATPEDYLTAVQSALASKAELSRLIPQDHAEGVIRRFLAEVERQLSLKARK